MNRSVKSPRPTIFRMRGLRLALSVCVLALCGVALVPAAQAQFTQWNGSVNSDWFNAANWSNGVPDATTEVRINWFGGAAPVLSANTTIRRLNMGSNNQTLTIASGVTLTVNQDIAIGNSGTLNVADGNVVVTQASTVSGGITVNDGSITFLGNLTQNGSSVFTVQTGTVNIGDPGPPVVSANFTQTGGAIFNLNQGTLNIYGVSQFTGGGTFNAGSGSINMNGDIQFNGGANFNPDTSTVTISGSVTITSNSNQEATFYDLVIEEDSEVVASVNVTVNNNMTVADESGYENVNQTTLNVVGEVEGDPKIDSPRPYIVTLIITSPTTIQAVFNKEMNASTTQVAGNYRVELQDGTVIDNMASSNPTLVDDNRVNFQLSFTIEPDVSYFLIANNLQSADGATISTDHRKRFLDATPPLFYSRQTGFWDLATSWSLESHTGPAAPRVPGQSGDQVVVGDAHEITIRTSVSLAPLAQTLVNDGAALQVNADGTLLTGTRSVTGQGTFALQAGATLQIGLPQGITTAGGPDASQGNIRTAQRFFSEQAHYIYSGSGAQVTGDGLPETVASLTINNAQGVTISGGLRVEGMLTLQTGVLSVGSGLSLIADTRTVSGGSVRYLRDLTGMKGWRLMASPVQTDFTDFVIGPDGGGFTTQGFTGSDLPEEQPNILSFLESGTQDTTTVLKWRTLTSISDAVVPGKGYFVYVFDGAAGPGAVPARGDELPFTISASGEENTPAPGQSFDFDVSYTERDGPGGLDDGWNLIGNPFGAYIDWSDTDGWERSHMHASMYIWDPAANNGFGEYRYWNTLTGNGGDSGSGGSNGGSGSGGPGSGSSPAFSELPTGGLIAPFQAFWVKAEQNGAELRVKPEARTLASAGYFGEEVAHQRRLSSSAAPIEFEELVLRLRHTQSGLAGETRIVFSEAGHFGADRYDTYRLVPLTDTYVSLFTVREDDRPLAINSLPAQASGTWQIPLETYGLSNGMPLQGEVRLEWGSLDRLADDLSVFLVDTRTGERVNMRRRSAHSFDLASTQSAAYRKAAQHSEQAESLSGVQPFGAGLSARTGDSPSTGQQTSGKQAPATAHGTAAAGPSSQRVAANHPGASFQMQQHMKAREARFRVEITRRTVSEQAAGQIPGQVELMQNYPNPFNPATTIRFGLPEETRVRLTLYDVLGRQVAVLADGVYGEGVHQIPWQASGHSSGVYLYRLQTDHGVITRKMTLMQ